MKNQVELGWFPLYFTPKFNSRSHQTLPLATASQYRISHFHFTALENQILSALLPFFGAEGRPCQLKPHGRGSHPCFVPIWSDQGLLAGSMVTKLKMSLI